MRFKVRESESSHPRELLRREVTVPYLGDKEGGRGGGERGGGEEEERIR